MNIFYHEAHENHEGMKRCNDDRPALFVAFVVS